MKTFLSIGALVAIMTPNIEAWGGDGHNIVGMIAQKFLDANAATYVSKILEPTYEGQLGPAATWADSVKHTKPYSWSGPLHYADALDKAPKSCGYDDVRDCKGNCIISAISNYTKRLACSSKSDTGAQAEALKFLAHFLGDITQPLHLENRDVGGNTDVVTFDGASSKLHTIWDTAIPVKHMKADYGGKLEAYADDLVKKMNSGEYAGQKSKWSSCVDPTKAGDSDNLACPIEWAQDSNAFNCGPVLWTGYLADTTADLGGKYYKDAYPIVDMQLAKGGLRLGLWLNAIFASCEGGTPTSAESSRDTTPPPTTTPDTTSDTTSDTPTTTPDTTPDATTTPTTPTASPTVLGDCNSEGSKTCIYKDGYSHLFKECVNGKLIKSRCPDNKYCFKTTTEDEVTCKRG